MADSSFYSEYERAILAAAAKYGSRTKAAKALGIDRTYFKMNPVRNATRKTAERYFAIIMRGSSESAPRGEPSTVPVSGHHRRPPGGRRKSLPEYDPGQAGIDFTSRVLRLAAELLLSFSMIADEDRRRVVRRALQGDVELMLQAIRIHASELPLEAAKLFGNEDVLALLGLSSKGHSTVQ